MFGETFVDRQKPMVLVLGLGESGLAMARWCARQGCRLRVADTRAAPPNLQALASHGIEAQFAGGAFSPALLDDGIELVALSPGLSPLAQDLVPLIAHARERGIPVWGEVEFFAQALRHLGESGYAPKVVAITGTNGKTTTTALVAHLLSAAGLRATTAGNIGRPVTDLAMSDERYQWLSLEVSSFQLHDSPHFAPQIGVLTNLAPDHLDRYPSAEAYYADKKLLFRNAAADNVWVLNADDRTISRIDPKTKARMGDFESPSGVTDIAAGAGALWVGTGEGQGGNWTDTVHRIDPATDQITHTETLPKGLSGGDRFYLNSGFTQMAVGAGAVWVKVDDGAHRRQVGQIGVGEKPEIGHRSEFLRRDADQVRKLVADETG